LVWVEATCRFGVVLLGRRTECETLDQLVGAVRTGESRALVVHGEAGVGKSALLDYLHERASGCRVARAVGVQSEMELAFAALHLLCAPMLDRLDRIPEPQRNALGTAFGMRRGPAPDRFLVGLAVLSLLAEVAAERPLICLIDDAQWLDRASAQALAFVARRLFTESVALVFAVRDLSDQQEMTGLPDMAIGGLREGDARALLSSVVHGPLDEHVRDQIVAETHGNPLALIELPHASTNADIAGGFGLPAAPALSGRIEEGFGRRLAALPPDAQLLVLVAAADPIGDPVLVLRAADQLGIEVDGEALEAASDLVGIGPKVRFHHPLVRSATYRSASGRQRRSVHHALAEVTDPEVDPDRRAWHRSRAAVGHDEDVAAELERSASRAQARGGLAAAAAFLERATELTPDEGRRAARALAAAQAKLEAGAPDAAAELLAAAQAGPLDSLQRARVDLLRAEIAFTVNRGNDAPPLLLRAAGQFEVLDVASARDTYLEAMSAAMFAGRLATGGGLVEVAEAARTAPPAPPQPRPADLLLDGLALRVTEGYRSATPTMQRALRAFDTGEISVEEELRCLWLACIGALDVWDDESWRRLTVRHVQVARDAGALAVLPIVLSMRIAVHLFDGELSEAAALVEEVQTITEATGTHLTPHGALALAAWQGRAADARELIEASMKGATARSEGIGVTVIQWVSAVLYNGLGQYEPARAAAQRSSENPVEFGAGNWALPELVEAATRTGDLPLAAETLERLSERTRYSGTDWGRGIEARSRALVADGEIAEDLYREAIERLGRTRLRPELARAHLLYGEWLRRERRRLDAREALRTAHHMFTAMGLDAFAQRAAGELLATGETARKRTVEAAGQLTAQEAQIARLARDRLSNPEIGARLFISPRTVEYHLRKVFTKLDITSRNQLDSVPLSDPNLAQPA
jgi:DNA-binding CsgD family transcriptional regulator